MAAPKALTANENVGPSHRTGANDQGHGRRWRPRKPTFGGFLHQLVLILTAILLYFGVRGITEGDVSEAIANGFDILEWEQRTGIAIERWAQDLILDHGWLVTLSNWVYIWGHWPAIAVVLVWLHRSNRMEFLRLRNAMFVSGAIGLIIFTLHPVAPPRLLGAGFSDTVSDFSNSYRILQPPALVNKYAAVPSLHVGWNLLIGVALIHSSKRLTVKLLGVVSPVAMAFAVVVTANHYVIDAVIGALLALFGFWISWLITPYFASIGRHPPEEVEVVEDESVDTPVG